MKYRFRRAPMLLAVPVALLTLASVPRVQALFVPSPQMVERLVQVSLEKPPADPPVHLDVPYRSTLMRTHRLDIYEPTGGATNTATDGRADTSSEDAVVHDRAAAGASDHVPGVTARPPIVVFLHGGSWIQGDKITIRIVDRFLSRMREAGYFVAAVNYTTSIFTGISGTLENARAAIRWLANHADEYGYDPYRIGLYGVSAGGHLALLAASTMDSSDLDFSFVFAECAPTDLVGMRDGDAFDKSGVFRVFPETRLRDLSPIAHVSDDLPPVLIFHGGQDRTVHLNQSTRYVDALDEAGGEAELVVYPQGDHAFLNMTPDEWFEQESVALDFFAEHFEPDL